MCEPARHARHARHASQTCEACEASESDVRGMRARRVRHARQPCEACESCIRSFLMTSNQIKKTDKGVGVYFKGQNVESVLSSQGYFK